MSTVEKTKLEHQLAMVFDLNKCIGCQTCSVACKVLWGRDEGMEHQWWATVNTQPGKGTPKDWEQMGGGERGGVSVPGHLPTREEFGGGWDYDFQRLFYGGNGKKEALRPTGGASKWGPNWDEDQGAGEYPNTYYFYLPRICNHCTNPVCVEACPRAAMFKRPEDGIVVRDEDSCRGYRFCMEACPYKKIYFNYVRNIGQQCIFCLPRLEEGVAPACARQCPVAARLRRLPRRRERPDPQAGQRVEGGAAAPPGVRDGAERVLRAAALARPDQAPTGRSTPRRRGSRSSTWKSCSARASAARSTRSTPRWRRCAAAAAPRCSTR